MTPSTETTSADRDASVPSLAVLAGLLLLCVGGGALIGTLFSNTGEYQNFSLPPWAPPGWIFGPVWTVLYTLMAISAWMVWRRDHPFRARALAAFAVQLVINFAWTPVFFGGDRYELALAVIIGVLLAAGWWAFEAWRVHRLAGSLQVSYVAWVAFATALNAAIAVG